MVDSIAWYSQMDELYIGWEFYLPELVDTGEWLR